MQLTAAYDAVGVAGLATAERASQAAARRRASLERLIAARSSESRCGDDSGHRDGGPGMLVSASGEMWCSREAVGGCAPSATHHRSGVARFDITSGGTPTRGPLTEDRCGLAHDERERRGNRTAYPWRAFARLTSTISSAGGSGIFVGPKHVLTAGHNVWIAGAGADGLLKVRVRAGNDEANGGTRRVQWYYVPHGFMYAETEHESNINDFALLILEETDNYTPGCFDYAHASRDYVDGRNLWNFGFPSQACMCSATPDPGSFGYQAPRGGCGEDLYGQSSRVTRVFDYLLQTNHQTQIGMSGSPLYEWFGETDRRVYGTLVGSTSEGTIFKRLRHGSFTQIQTTIAAWPHDYWGTSC
ncbi:MAG: trypsin-like peptidase domain-containing protein [Nannocystaceae bacterium]